jgi:hypothetical protein
MNSISDPLQQLEHDFVARLGEFVATLNSSGHKCSDPDTALSYLEILLAAKPYIENEPEKFGFSKSSALEWHKARLQDGISEFFRHLDSEGLIAGYDIDGKQWSTAHYRATPIICDSLRLLDAEQLAELHDEIERQKTSSTIIFKLLKPYSLHKRPGYRGLNLILSDIAGLHEAGVYFEEPEWIETARLAKERAIARQDPEGFYPDSRGDDDTGPSSVYMEFTLLAAYPEPSLADRCVRGVDWMMKSYDLSGRPIDIFDERERFKRSSGSGGIGWPSPLYFFSPVGREWLSFTLERSGTFMFPYSATVLNFKRTLERKNPDFLKALERSATWFTRQPRFCYRYENKKSAISVNRPWLIAGHGYLTGKLDPKSMWHRELQQHASLHHQTAGIIFGGGNSLAQKEFSTLRTGRSYLCSRVFVEHCNESLQTVFCENSRWQIAIHTAIANENEATVKCEVLNSAAGKAFWQLTLGMFLTRKQLLYQNNVVTDFFKDEVSGVLEDAITVVGSNDGKNFRVKISFSHPCEFSWPLYPVNVREPGSKPMPLYTAVLPLKFSLPERGTCIELSVKYSST